MKQHSPKKQNLLPILLGLALLLLGAGLRMPGIDFGLPYIRHNDEPNFYRLAQDLRGNLDAGYRKEWLVGYPPGYIWQYRLMLDLTDWFGENDVHRHMARYVGTARIINVLLDVLTIAIVFRTAFLLGQAGAAVLAGSVYAIAAAIVEHASYALPDTPTITLCALTMLLTVMAFKRHRWQWGLAAAATGCAATVMKYPAAPVLFLPGMYFLMLLIRQRHRALLPAALAAMLVAGTMYGLFVIYGGAGLSNVESYNVRAFFWVNITSPTRLSWTLNGLLGVVGQGLMMWGGVALVFILLQRAWARVWLGLLVLVGGLLILGLVPAYLSDNPGAMYPTRYVQPAGVLLIPALAALVMHGIFFKWRWQSVWGQRGLYAVILGMVLSVFVPDLLALMRTMQGTISYQLAQHWIDTTIPETDVIWTESGAVFNSLSRYDRGFASHKNFQVWFGEPIDQITPQDKAQVRYLYLNATDVTTWSRTAGWEVLSAYTLLKTIEGSDVADEAIYFYLPKALPNPQNTVFSSSLAQLALTGIAVKPTATHLHIESYWQTSQQPPVAISYVVYLTPRTEPTTVLAQQDGQLGYRPTDTWADPHEILLGNITPLALPPATSGDYMVWLALYYWQTDERFVLADGTNALPIAEYTPGQPNPISPILKSG